MEILAALVACLRALSDRLALNVIVPNAYTQCREAIYFLRTIMSEHSDASTKGGSQGERPNFALARGIARAMWLVGYKEANPASTPAMVNSAWKEVRQEHTKPVLQAVKAMAKRGYVFIPPTTEADDDSSDE